jgi:hypothetical protein
MTNLVSMIDARIIAKLEAGDIEGAAMLAAKQADPRAHLAAMRIVNEYMHKPPGAKRMTIEFSEKTATVVKFETDKRVSDDPTKEALPIAEVDFELNLSGDLLAIFAPTMRALLFHKNGAVQHDLASQTHEAPDVRHPKILPPYRWRENMEGATLTIHQGLGGKSDLVLSDASIATFFITPNEGGTFLLGFQARAKVEQERYFGRLAMLLKKDVTISLEAPKPPADEE